MGNLFDANAAEHIGPMSLSQPCVCKCDCSML